MQTKEFVILTYPALSQYSARPLECPICRRDTNTYVTANSKLEEAPLYCKHCERYFITNFDGARKQQRSLI